MSIEIKLRFNARQAAELDELMQGVGLDSRTALIGEALALYRKAAVQSLKEGRWLCSFRADDPDGTCRHFALPWEEHRDDYDLEERRRLGLDREPEPAGAGAGRS